MKGFKTVQNSSLFASRVHFSTPVNIFENYLYRKPFYTFVLKDNKIQTFASETS